MPPPFEPLRPPATSSCPLIDQVTDPLIYGFIDLFIHLFLYPSHARAHIRTCTQKPLHEGHASERGGGGGKGPYPRRDGMGAVSIPPTTRAYGSAPRRRQRASPLATGHEQVARCKRIHSLGPMDETGQTLRAKQWRAAPHPLRRLRSPAPEHTILGHPEKAAGLVTGQTHGWGDTHTPTLPLFVASTGGNLPRPSRARPHGKHEAPK